MVDKVSHFLFLEKLTNKSSKTIIKGLEAIFCSFGCPQILSSDNMLGFDSIEVNNFLKSSGIYKHPNVPYYSNHSNFSEAGINIIKRLYQKSLSTKQSLERLVFLRNVFPHSLGKYTPFQVMFNQQANFTLCLLSADNIPSSD